MSSGPFSQDAAQILKKKLRNMVAIHDYFPISALLAFSASLLCPIPLSSIIPQKEAWSWARVGSPS